MTSLIHKRPIKKNRMEKRNAYVTQTNLLVHPLRQCLQHPQHLPRLFECLPSAYAYEKLIFTQMVATQNAFFKSGLEAFEIK